MKLKLPILLLISTVILCQSAHAQGVSGNLSTPLALTPSTESPMPGQEVTITAESFVIDINAASVTWTADGVVIGKGTGVKTVTIKSPALGKKTQINVIAVSASGNTVRGTMVLSSGSIDMILESDGYVPPFYRGKTPMAYQNAAKITAIPHLADASGKEYDPQTLVYKWWKGSTALQDQSGYGRQSVTLPNSIIPRPYNVSVTVTSKDGEAQSDGLTGVTAISPSLSFYRNDPLYGALYNNQIGDTVYIGAGREVGILAVPFGFNKPAEGIGDLTLSWSVNNIESKELASKQSITLRAPEGQSGSSNIDLTINNTENILQQAKAAFTAIFNSSETR